MHGFRFNGWFRRYSGTGSRGRVGRGSVRSTRDRVRRWCLGAAVGLCAAFPSVAWAAGSGGGVFQPFHETTSTLAPSEFPSLWSPGWVFATDGLVIDDNEGEVTATNGTGQPTTELVRWNSWGTHVYSMPMPDPSSSKPCVIAEISHAVGWSGAQPVDGVGGIQATGSYAGYVATPTRNARITTYGSVDATPGTTFAGGSVVSQSLGYRSERKMTGQYITSRYLVFIPKSGGGYYVHEFIGARLDSGNGKSLVYKFPTTTVETGNIGSYIDGGTVSGVNGFSAWKSSGSYQAYKWGARMAHGQGYAVVSLPQANAAIEAAESVSADDWGSGVDMSSEITTGAATPGLSEADLADPEAWFAKIGAWFSALMDPFADLFAPVTLIGGWE